MNRRAGYAWEKIRTAVGGMRSLAAWFWHRDVSDPEEDNVVNRALANYDIDPPSLLEDEPLPEEDDWECPERDAELIYGTRMPRAGGPSDAGHS